MTNIVTIGGGNGHAIALRALKQLKLEGAQFEITAIVTVADNGGSSGRLRKEFNILPPGDLLRASMALSDYDFSALRQFFYEQRFTDTHSKLAGHNVGNLLIKHLHDQTGSMVLALKELVILWRLHGTVLPVTLDNVELCAELENGKKICGETNIDVPQYDPQIRKKRVWLEPEGKLLPEAREKIEKANYLVLGPGDLFTSIIPGILMSETYQAIKNSNAQIVFIAGLANRLQGETRDFTAVDFVHEINCYLPRLCDLFVGHNVPQPKNIQLYIDKGWQWITRNEDQLSMPVTKGDLEHETRAGMDYAKLASVLKNILV